MKPTMMMNIRHYTYPFPVNVYSLFNGLQKFLGMVNIFIKIAKLHNKSTKPHNSTSEQEPNKTLKKPRESW